MGWEDRFVPVKRLREAADECRCEVCGATYPAYLASCGCGRCLAERGVVVSLAGGGANDAEGRP